MALHKETLFHTRELAVRYVRCRAEGPRPGALERGDADVVVLPFKGSFIKHFGPRDAVVAAPSTALLFAAGRAHRVSHPSSPADECLALELAAPLLRPLLVEHAGVDSFADARLRSQVTLPAALVAARGVLAHRLRAGALDGLAAVEITLGLVAAIVGSALTPQRAARPLDPSARQREQVRAVEEALVEEGEAAQSLTELARLVEATPFHLARIFRRVAGVPVHEYRLRLRLARSLGPLLESDRDLTTIALEHGFSSHSHYTYAFRRRAGVTPSALRRIARRGAPAELVKIMTALAPTGT